MFFISVWQCLGCIHEDSGGLPKDAICYIDAANKNQLAAGSFRFDPLYIKLKVKTKAQVPTPTYTAILHMDAGTLQVNSSVLRFRSAPANQLLYRIHRKRRADDLCVA